MKKRTNYFVLLLFITTLLVSFNSNAQDTEQATNSEFELLVEYLEANGNFINSELAPAVVLASEIKDNLKNSKYLVLDIRSESWFDYGHIKNATNIKAEELLNYFENEIDPKSFDKITIVCYSGQSAAYYAGLLRLAGYNNVFNLKWGMSSWDEEFATNIWLKNSKSTYLDKLETTSNEMSKVDNLPILNTGKTTGEEILKERIKEVFAKPYKEFIVKVDSAFTSPNDFYIVNYVSEENHNFGHIPGAVRYQPSTSLSSTSNLYTLPTDKNILVNCETGFSGAFTVAYLNILGYKASNLAYGSNSFMNSVLIEKGWNGFSNQEVNSYPISE